MINFRSINFYILLFPLAVFLLNIFGLADFQFLKIVSYLFTFWGISIFYNSFLKQFRTGIFFGCVLFLAGSNIFILTQFEILDFGRVFIPVLFAITGFSLLLTNLLTEINRFALALSIFLLFASITLILTRGTASFDLFGLSVFAILKNYWIVIILTAAVIFITIKESKKKKL